MTDILDELELTERVALSLDDEARSVGPMFDLLITGNIINTGEIHIPDIILTSEPTPITPRRYQRLDAFTTWLATGLRHRPAHAIRPPPYPIPPTPRQIPTPALTPPPGHP